MSTYKYDGGVTRLSLAEAGDLLYVRIAKGDESDFLAVGLPADERQAAAQALAGDEWRVVSAKQPGPPAPIDPADVKVGDVAEVEAADGSWLVRGEVNATDPRSAYPFSVTAPSMGGTQHWVRLTDATVRLVRRAEPDPDPEQVEALEEVMADFREWHRRDPREFTNREMAEWMARRVTVRKDGAA